MRLNRRQLLGSALATGLVGPNLARAATPSGADLKFVFVYALGGWDPTRVLADGFDHDGVDMEPGSERVMTGDLAWIDHPDRPSVRTFFEAYGDRAVAFNGVLIRSIAHEICQMISMTGSTSGIVPDWPAIIAAAAADRYTLPHLVLNGPSYPGDLGTAVARSGANGQLDRLLSGDILAYSDSMVSSPDRPVQDRIDRYLLGRARSAAENARSPSARRLTQDFERATVGATGLKDYRYVVDFDSGTQLSQQIDVVVAALKAGLSRCVTVSSGFLWDTHVDNDATQSGLWNQTFQDLGTLMSKLQTTPGQSGGSLADETVVVVMSEMGRTPQLNGFGGKDHWPYSSWLAFGPGLGGGRSIGAFDDYWYGKFVDPATGEVTESGGEGLSAESVGATLLALADIDPAEHVEAAKPITGVLA